MKKRLITIFFFFPLHFCLSAQNETSKWYFGRNVAFDFTSSGPVNLSTSAIDTPEGCASMSDANGNLLFYTDGATIWNQMHVPMLNGTGLLGNGPSFTSQAALILKQPGTSFIYYVFTLDDVAGPNGLKYSQVDMSLAAGAGSVTIKNTALLPISSEKLTATKHCNGSDYWIMTHDTNNVFRAFLLTASGINTTAVVSSFASTGKRYITGYMKFSPNGEKIVSAALASATNGINGGFELWDFDASSGTVSNCQLLWSGAGAYGCEFSSQSNILYGSAQTGTNLQVFQWSLCGNSLTQIQSSQLTVSSSSLTKYALQLAKDNKIYLAKAFAPELGVIQNPNLAGIACGYLETGPAVTTGSVWLGLPNFSTDYFYSSPQDSFISLNINNCVTNFSAQSCYSSKLMAAAWNFGDPSTGAANTSTLINPGHQFSSPGPYSVKLVRYYKCHSDTLTQTINVPYSNPIIVINGNPKFCKGNASNLTASGAGNYQWIGPGGTYSTFVSPLLSGVYTYTISGSDPVYNCSASKTFTVEMLDCSSLNKVNVSPLSVFPNPVYADFTVQCNFSGELKINNAQGEGLLVQEVFPGTNRVDCSVLPIGLYVVELKDVPGSVKYCKFLKY